MLQPKIQVLHSAGRVFRNFTAIAQKCHSAKLQWFFGAFVCCICECFEPFLDDQKKIIKFVDMWFVLEINDNIYAYNPCVPNQSF